MVSKKCLRKGRSLTASLTGTPFCLRDAVARTWPLSCFDRIEAARSLPLSRLHHYASRHPLPAARPVSLFGPATLSLPSMYWGFTTPHSPSRIHTTAQVRGTVETCVVRQCEVARSAVSGKFSGTAPCARLWRRTQQRSDFPQLRQLRGLSRTSRADIPHPRRVE